MPNKNIQAFLNIWGFDFRNFWFNAVHNSISYSSPLVLLSNLDFCDFCFWHVLLYVNTLTAQIKDTCSLFLSSFLVVFRGVISGETGKAVSSPKLQGNRLCPTIGLKFFMITSLNSGSSQNPTPPSKHENSVILVSYFHSCHIVALILHTWPEQILRSKSSE